MAYVKADTLRMRKLFNRFIKMTGTERTQTLQAMSLNDSILFQDYLANKMEYGRKLDEAVAKFERSMTK